MGSSSVSFPSPVGAAAAVLLIMGTIFLGRAAKGRRVARRALDHKETNFGNPNFEENEPSNPEHEEANHDESDVLEELEQSHPRADDVVWDIFLSHSGKQKPFVERLNDALQSTNHTVFFDQHSLPKGSPFPPCIEQAARGCKMGVVVLSEEFLTSKWPMKELEMLVSRRVPEPRVFPLFYELKPADLTSSEKLSKWRGVWKKMGGENVAKQWEEAVKTLKRSSGEVYEQGTSTGTYIKRVVQRICNLVPCHVPYDCSLIQGQSRLAQKVAAKLEQVDASQARMVGLHGVGGLGKTTLCKVMVNYYSSHYYGKSFLIEFPSPGGEDKLAIDKLIVWECKKALNKLTGASYEHLLNKVDSFDQVVQLMRDRMVCHDVFLAIDNVWESYLEEAKRVLRVGFSANSKILVTSRSEQVLKDLLMVRGHVNNNVSVAPLPAPEREEAFQIFQKTFESYDLSTLVDSNQIDKVLGRCKFSGSYHALALKALATYVKRVCMTVDSEEGIKHHLSHVLEEISFEDLSDVKKVIRLSYDNLSKQKKFMFLDIIVCLREQKIRWYPTRTKAQDWISFLYWKFPKSKTTRLINELSLDGLIQTELGKDGTEEIGSHDLYNELAWSEIASSPRFLIKDITESVEKIKWEKLEIVILNGDKPIPCFLEKLQQSKCPNLKLLIAINIEMKSGNWLNSMPSLSALTLERITLVESGHWSATTNSGLDSEKENVVQSPLLQPLEQVPVMPSLDQEGTIKNSRSGFVRGEGLVDASHILHLNGLVELRKLEVKKCKFVEEIAGLDALGNLQMLTVVSCQRLKSLDGLSGLVQLQVLHVSHCRSLQKLPDVSSLTCLERLELHQNEAMEEVGGEYLRSTLKHLDITDGRSLRSCPNLDEGMHLETLATGWAHHIRSLQKLPNPHTCLRRLIIDEGGGSTIKKINVGCLMNLKDLDVNHCGALEEIAGLSALQSLQRLRIGSCPSLKKLNLGCASLKMLSVWQCEALEEIIWDLKALPSREELVNDVAMEEVGVLRCTLKEVSVIDCKVLKRMPNVTCLERLELCRNEAMEEVGVLSCTLKEVKVTECKVLKRMPDVSSLTCLERLELQQNKAMEEVGGEYFSSTLKHLAITACRSLRSCPRLDEGMHLETLATGYAHYISSLQKLPNLHTCLRSLTIGLGYGGSTIKSIDVGCLTNLRTLAVKYCKALEEIEDLNALCSLKRLDIQSCSSLKKLNVGCPSALRSLEDLRIQDCPRLKELNVGCASLKDLSVRSCQALEEIIWDLRALPSLEKLLIENCQSLKKLEGISSTPLHHLTLTKCDSLQEGSIPEAILPNLARGPHL